MLSHNETSNTLIGVFDPSTAPVKTLRHDATAARIETGLHRGNTMTFVKIAIGAAFLAVPVSAEAAVTVGDRITCTAVSINDICTLNRATVGTGIEATSSHNYGTSGITDIFGLDFSSNSLTVTILGGPGISIRNFRNSLNLTNLDRAFGTITGFSKSSTFTGVKASDFTSNGQNLSIIFDLVSEMQVIPLQ